MEHYEKQTRKSDQRVKNKAQLCVVYVNIPKAGCVLKKIKVVSNFREEKFQIYFGNCMIKCIMSQAIPTLWRWVEMLTRSFWSRNQFIDAIIVSVGFSLHHKSKLT